MASDVPGASSSTAVAGLTTRGLSTDNTVNIAFGLAAFVLSVLGILLSYATWQLARRGRRIARRPTGAGLDDYDVELQRLPPQPGDGYEVTFQLRRHA